MEVMVGRDGCADDPDPTTAEVLSEDTVFSLLSAGRRRAVLRTLEAADGELPLATLTREVAMAEGVAPDADPGQFKTVYVSLYQTHVPALADAGVVEYDAERKVACLTGRAEPLFVYLDVADGVGDADTSGTKGLLSRLFRGEPPAD